MMSLAFCTFVCSSYFLCFVFLEAEGEVVPDFLPTSYVMEAWLGDAGTEIRASTHPVNGPALAKVALADGHEGSAAARLLDEAPRVFGAVLPANA